MIKYLIFFLTLNFTILTYANEPAKAGASSDKPFGEVGFVTNYVEKGITQSQGSPAFQGGFAYNVGEQFQFGIWGSVVSYENEDTSSLVRPHFLLKIPFSGTNSLHLGVRMKTFYKASSRNTQVNILKLNLTDFIIEYESCDNWEGTNKKGTRLSLEKRFLLNSDFYAFGVVGYNSISETGYTSYADISTGLGAQMYSLNYEAILNYASNGSQFGAAGSPAVVLAITAKF